MAGECADVATSELRHDVELVDLRRQLDIVLLADLDKFLPPRLSRSVIPSGRSMSTRTAVRQASAASSA